MTSVQLTQTRNGHQRTGKKTDLSNGVAKIKVVSWTVANEKLAYVLSMMWVKWTYDTEVDEVGNDQFVKSQIVW